jgi:hypothetical protein
MLWATYLPVFLMKAAHLRVARRWKSTGDIRKYFGGDPNTTRPDGDPIIIRFINDRNLEGLRMMKEHGANLDLQRSWPKCPN